MSVPTPSRRATPVASGLSGARRVPSTAGRPRGTDLPVRALMPFLLMTFGITWTLFALFLLAPDLVTRWLGPPSGSHPLFIIGTWAPAL